MSINLHQRDGQVKILEMEKKIVSPFKSVVINDMLVVLDNQIIAFGAGVIQVYQINYSEENIVSSLKYVTTIDKDTVGVQNSDAKINGFEYTSIPNTDSYHFYFTLSNVGIVLCSLKINDTININNCIIMDYMEKTPPFLAKYSVTYNLILQVKIIGSDI